MLRERTGQIPGDNQHLKYKLGRGQVKETEREREDLWDKKHYVGAMSKASASYQAMDSHGN